MKRTINVQLQLYLVKLLESKSRDLSSAVRQYGRQSLDVEVLRAEIDSIKSELKMIERERRD